MKIVPPTRSHAPRRASGKHALRLDAADPRGLPTIILFDRGSARLRAAYRDALRRHVLYLQAFGQKAVFVLHGHSNLRTNE